MPEIKLRQWLPDLPDLGNPGWTVVTNALPGSGGYIPHPDLSVASSNALNSKALGAFAGIDSAGNTATMAGSATKLYTYSGGAFTDATRLVGGDYALAGTNRWDFAQWNNQIIATAWDEPVQEITIGGANFADLITSTRKPQARHIGVIRDFLVLGNVTDTTDGDMPSRVWWSAFEDATNFDPAIADLSGIQDLETGDGEVKAIAGGEFGLIFTENAIYRMTFEGAPTIFRFDKVIRNKGTIAQGSVTGFGRLTFFIAEDGFYVTDGAEAIPIGKNKVDRTFTRDADPTLLHEITSTIEPQNSLVCWAYASSSNAGNSDRIITYNWSNQNWSISEMTTEMIFNHRSTSETIDGATLGTTLIDDETRLIDAPEFKGGTPVIAAFDSLHQLNTFAGSAQDAVFVSGEFQPFEGQKTYINSVTPVVDGPTAVTTVQIGSRELQTDTPAFSSSASLNAEGRADLRQIGRYNRIRLDVSGGFNEALGVQFNAKAAGRR